MKKIALTLLAFITFSLVILGPYTEVYAQTMLLAYDGSLHTYTNNIYSLEINGEKISTEIPPIVLDNRTLVPARTVFEKLGATVNWDAANQKVSVEGVDNKDIALTINDTNAVVNNDTVKLDVPAKIINDKTMIPVRFVAEELNMNVGWFPKDDLITLDSNDSSPAADNIKNINYSTQNGQDVVTISLDNYKNYNIVRLSDPDRIVIDFPNADAPINLQKIDTNGSFVKAIRYAQFDANTARVVLDVNGQPDYNVAENAGNLTVYVSDSSLRNLVYHNSEDRTGFILSGAKLTEGDEAITKKLYTEKVEQDGKKYTITFPSNLADIGSGVLKINDSFLDSVEITTDNSTQNTSITFNAKDAFYYEIITRPSTNDTAITFLKPAAKTDKLVVIDAGHGGIETGAAPSADFLEKNLNLDIALRLNALLKSKNVKTYMIREDDEFVGLYERAYIANNLNAALFFSIHNNAFTSDCKGTMTLYDPGEPDSGGFNSYKFANIVQSSLLSALNTDDDHIIERPNLVVLRETHMPAVLAEVAYMTNKDDKAKLLTLSFRQKAASALCDAIVQALSQTK